MKEDDISQLWKQIETSSDQFYKETIKSNLEIIVNNKTNNTMDNVIKKAKWEIGISICIILPLLWFNDFSGHGGIILVLTIIFGSLWTHSIFKNLFDPKLRSGDMKTSLELKLTIMKKFITRYKLFSYIGIPLAALAGILIITVDAPEIEWSLGLILFIIAFAIAISAMILPFLPKYIHKLYGRHLDELERIKEELEEGYSE